MDDYPLLDLFFTLMWLYFLFAWFYLLIVLIGDVFRSRDLSGLAKAMWLLFLVVLPLIGAITYLISRGDQLHDRQAEEASRNAALRWGAAASSPSSADEISKLAELRDSGTLTEDEFQEAKAKVLTA